jgi:hypothetical protein
MPPRAITRGAWTPAERVGAVIVLWAAVITIISIGVILWAVLT